MPSGRRGPLSSIASPKANAPRTPLHSHVIADVTDAGTAAALDVPASGDAAVGEVVKGDDTRLTDAREWLFPSDHGVEQKVGEINGNDIYHYVGLTTVAAASAAAVLSEAPVIPQNSTILRAVGTFQLSSGAFAIPFGYFDGTNAYNFYSQLIAGNYFWFAAVVGGASWAVGDKITCEWVYAKVAL